MRVQKLLKILPALLIIFMMCFGLAFADEGTTETNVNSTSESTMSSELAPTPDTDNETVLTKVLHVVLVDCGGGLCGNLGDYPFLDQAGDPDQVVLSFVGHVMPEFFDPDSMMAVIGYGDSIIKQTEEIETGTEANKEMVDVSAATDVESQEKENEADDTEQASDSTDGESDESKENAAQTDGIGSSVEPADTAAEEETLKISAFSVTDKEQILETVKEIQANKKTDSLLGKTLESLNLKAEFGDGYEYDVIIISGGIEIGEDRTKNVDVIGLLNKFQEQENVKSVQIYSVEPKIKKNKDSDYVLTEYLNKVEATPLDLCLRIIEDLNGGTEINQLNERESKKYTRLILYSEENGFEYCASPMETEQKSQAFLENNSFRLYPDMRYPIPVMDDVFSKEEYTEGESVNFSKDWPGYQVSCTISGGDSVPDEIVFKTAGGYKLILLDRSGNPIEGWEKEVKVTAPDSKTEYLPLESQEISMELMVSTLKPEDGFKEIEQLSGEFNQRNSEIKTESGEFGNEIAELVWNQDGTRLTALGKKTGIVTYKIYRNDGSQADITIHVNAPWTNNEKILKVIPKKILFWIALIGAPVLLIVLSVCITAIIEKKKRHLY